MDRSKITAIAAGVVVLGEAVALLATKDHPPPEWVAAHPHPTPPIPP